MWRRFRKYYVWFVHVGRFCGATVAIAGFVALIFKLHF